MEWFLTGDTHFHHANIIQYCSRPYHNVTEMNEALIENWNSVVKPNSSVIHCGDFAFANKTEQVTSILKKLNGNIHLIIGNHDRGHVTAASGFESVSNIRVFKINEIEITACHYAMRVWNKSHHGTYHCYGHSHGALPEDPYSRSDDVGVDANNFTPIHLEEFIKRMNKKKFTPVTKRSKSDMIFDC
jgi:calcineurin-like phosphoesterase family protein